MTNPITPMSDALVDAYIHDWPNEDPTEANGIEVDADELRSMLARIETLRAEVERLKTVEAKHNRLCLADLGGDGVWPCGCHHLIVDSYGSRKLLTAADGEMHQECDDHEVIRAELAQAREEIAKLQADIEERIGRGVRTYEKLCVLRGKFAAEKAAREKAEARVKEFEGRCGPNHHRCACGMISSTWPRQKEKSK